MTHNNRELPIHISHGVAALWLDGCTITGIAKYLGYSPRTIKKHAARAEDYCHAFGGRDAFMRLHYRADYAAAIKKRTADGKAGKLGWNSPEAFEQRRRDRLRG